MADGIEYDVAVIGGGPAGATVAALVAEQGPRVLLLERSRGPRFKVGESLIPATYWPLRRLGMLERMRASHFPPKYSVQFYGGDGRPSAPFYFSEADPRECSRTWQVLRSEFDALLLVNASEKGVEVRRGWTADEVLLDGQGAVGVRARGENGDPPREIRARVVVDASGQNGLLARRFGLLEIDPLLRNAAVYTHFRGGLRDPGIDAGATLVLRTEGRRSWFWYIPLPYDLVSVGVVGPVDDLIRDRSGDPQAIFDGELARCPGLVPRLRGTRQMRRVHVARDFTYRCRRIAGDGWVLAGDAFGFIDPLYSTGVFLALKSGELAADAILGGLETGDLSGDRLGAHGPEYVRGMEALRKLVYAYYDQNFSFARFVEAHPELRGEITHLLMGNVFGRPVNRLFEALGRMCRLPEDVPALLRDAAAAPSRAPRDGTALPAEAGSTRCL